jgi:hypothetical protein
MAFFAILVFMFAIVVFYACWDREYKAMLAGGSALRVLPYAAGCPILWFGGAWLISVLI